MDPPILNIHNAFSRLLHISAISVTTDFDMLLLCPNGENVKVVEGVLVMAVDAGVVFPHVNIVAAPITHLTVLEEIWKVISCKKCLKSVTQHECFPWEPAVTASDTPEPTLIISISEYE